MPKEKISDVEVVEPKVDGSERNGTLSWLCRHAGQIAKGGIAVVGLLALGGMGYFARSFFAGFFSGGKSAEKGLVAGEPGGAVARSEDLAGFELHDAPIELRDVSATVRKIDFDAVAAKAHEDAPAARALDFDALDKQAREDTQGTCALHDTPRSFAQNETLTGHGSPGFSPENVLPKIWRKVFEKTCPSDEDTWAIQQTKDEGYIVAGYTSCVEGGGDHFAILKLDSFGIPTWARIFGGNNGERAYSIQQTTDNGYIVVGYTNSVRPGKHMLILKLNQHGNSTVWAKMFAVVGYAGIDYAQFVQQTADDGYIVAGRTTATGTDNFLVLKLDKNGDATWARTFDGSHSANYGSIIQQTADQGYIVAGTTTSGTPRFLILKLDYNGETMWARTFGGTGDHEAVSYSIRQTKDNGYIVVGKIIGVVSAHNSLVLKLDSSGNKMWAKIFGSPSGDEAHSVQQTVDEGYIVAGSVVVSHSFASIFKLDNFGNKTWAKRFWGDSDGPLSIQQTADNGYIAVGIHWISGPITHSDMFVMKLDSTAMLPSYCSGTDIPWGVWDTTGLTLENVTRITQNVSVNTVSADQLILTDCVFSPPSLVCGRSPIVNIKIDKQAGCCAAGIGFGYSFTLANNTFIDLEGSALTYNATLSGGSLLPSWLSFDPMIQVFSGTPITAGAIGNLLIQVVATNCNQGSIIGTFTLKIAQTLNATSIDVPIHYTENTPCQLAPIVIITPSAAVIARLTLSNTIAGNFTVGISGNSTSTYDPVTGIWQASGKIADVNGLFSNLWYRPSLDFHGGFSVAVNITDSFGQNLNDRLDAAPLIVPILVYTNFKIHIKEGLILTTDMLSAQDDSVTADVLTFTTFNEQFGQFEFTRALGKMIRQFTKQDIIDGKVRIVQGGGDHAVTFEVMVRNLVAHSNSSAVVTTLRHYTTLVIGAISINKGETLTITQEMISAQNPDGDKPEQLSFFVSNMQHGQFESLEQPGRNISQFALSQVIYNQIRLAHDGSSNPPLFDILVDNMDAKSMPVRVRTQFKSTSEIGLSSFANLALGAGASLTAAVGFWIVKRQYVAHKKREKYPFANRIRDALKLDITNFESDKGTEFLQTVDVLARELLEKQGIDIKVLTHKELQELSVPVADAISSRAMIRRKGCGVFGRNTINHKAIRDNISEIANDAARKYREAVAQQAAPAKNTLTEPLISPVAGNNP